MDYIALVRRPDLKSSGSGCADPLAPNSTTSFRVVALAPHFLGRKWCLRRVREQYFERVPFHASASNLLRSDHVPTAVSSRELAEMVVVTGQFVPCVTANLRCIHFKLRSEQQEFLVHVANATGWGRPPHTSSDACLSPHLRPTRTVIEGSWNSSGASLIGQQEGDQGDSIEGRGDGKKTHITTSTWPEKTTNSWCFGPRSQPETMPLLGEFLNLAPYIEISPP